MAVLRGLRRLTDRLDAQQATAARLAAWLATCKDVVRVYHPSLEDFNALVADLDAVLAAAANP